MVKLDRPEVKVGEAINDGLPLDAKQNGYYRWHKTGGHQTYPASPETMCSAVAFARKAPRPGG
jgi:hypothetical protein